MIHKLLIYDNTENSPVGYSWKAGAIAFGWRFDRIVAANNLNDIHQALDEADPFTEAQYWGHGREGEPCFDHKPLPLPSDMLRSSGVSLIWFRCCSVLGGPRGIQYAERLAGDCNLAVAGHCGVIGTWGMQSGLVGVLPGDKPWWKQHEFTGTSETWKPRTVPATCMSLPGWTWGEK